MEADLADQTVWVEFVADFLNASMGDADLWPGSHFSEVYDWVYDPWQNTVYTTSGFEGEEWDADFEISSVFGVPNFPVAHSNAVEVTCK